MYKIAPLNDTNQSIEILINIQNNGKVIYMDKHKTNMTISRDSSA